MTTPVTVTPLAAYRNQTPYPFCPGCGHGPILDHLNAALGQLALDPRQVVIVSDIGCSGLSDQYFDTQAFHGLHGRSLTYATGLKLARPELSVIVVMGDGGTGIGGAHLLAASRRNLDLTLLVFNNFNYGMTGGQHSGTTPAGAATSTTPDGNLERPLDLCATVAAAGATWAWRGTSFDADLGDRIAEAIVHPGFALLDVWEPCTAYFAPRNRLTRKAIGELVDRLGFGRGVVHRSEAPEFGAAYREARRSAPRESSLAPRAIEPRFASALDRPHRMVLAGNAGGRVGTAARWLSRAAVASYLFSALRSDYPVTVKTGFSLAELVLSPEPVEGTASDVVDVLVVLAPEGRAQAQARLGDLADDGRVVLTAGVEPLVGGPDPEIVDPTRGPGRVRKGSLASVVAAWVALRRGLMTAEALRFAAGAERDRDELVAALAAAEALAAA